MAPRLLILLLSAGAVSACTGDPPLPAAQLAQPGANPPKLTDEFRPTGGKTATPKAPRLAGRYITARLMAPTWMRRAPRGRTLRLLRPRTEFGSRNVVAVLARRDGWLKVQSSRLPNHRHGWIPESRAILRSTNYSILVDRSRRRLVLRQGDRVLRRLPVAVGRPGNETPLGRYAVTDKLRPSDPTSPYGCCALALTGHQTKLVPGWPGGDRLAIHGTPSKGSIGQRVSLGCLRAADGDLELMLRRVPLGTPVFIRA